MKSIKIKKRILKYLDAKYHLISDIALESLFLNEDSVKKIDGCDIIRDIQLRCVPDWANVKLDQSGTLVIRTDGLKFTQENINWINTIQKDCVKKIKEHEKVEL